MKKESEKRGAHKDAKCYCFLSSWLMEDKNVKPDLVIPSILYASKNNQKR